MLLDKETPIGSFQPSGDGVSSAGRIAFPTWFLGGALVLISAASMAVEIVAGRALAPFVGMSLYTWTMIIAVVLAGLSIGHWIGGIAADRSTRLATWVGGALVLASLSTIGSLSVLRWLEPALSGVDPISHVGAHTLAAFFAPSLCAGVVSPLLTKMALEAAPQERHGRVIGAFFALGAAGAIVGTLVAGLVLVSWLGSNASMIAIGIVYALLAVPFLSNRARALSVLCAAAASFLAINGHDRLCDAESVYYCIQIDDLRPGGDARVMALDHLAHGVNSRSDPTLLYSPYVQGVDELVRRRFPQGSIAAAFIGGGAYTLPRAWLTGETTERALVIELDPVVTEIAREKLWLPSSERLEIKHGDARRILRESPDDHRFDVVFGDAFHDISIPQHLITDEFHREIKSRLRPGGVYAVNVVDLLREPRFLLSLARTLEQRFGFVELWIDLEEVGPVEKRTTWIVLASDKPSGVGEISATTGFPRRWVQVPLDKMVEAIGEDRLVTLTDDYSPVDRLLSGLLLGSAAEK